MIFLAELAFKSDRLLFLAELAFKSDRLLEQVSSDSFVFDLFCCQQNVRFLIVCRVVYPCSGCELKYSLRILFFEWNSKMRGFKIDPLPITVSDFLIEKAKQLQVLK